MNDLCFASATEIAARLRRGEFSASECLNYFRTRIERFNPQLNAIVVFDWTRAEQHAARADASRTRGEPAGPLLGVPMTIKESFDLAHHPTTWGDPALMNAVAAADDLIVERLTAAGAVIFGKSNVPLGLADFQSYNAIHGTTNNPWDLALGPGGSSGGAAAALAAGLTGLEVGSDIGGSIRNPAHYCGVFGHKPTYKLVGATRCAPPGVLMPTDMSVAGPLARSAEDLALAMNVLAAPGSFETPVWQPTLRRPHKQLSDYRVAIWAGEPGIEVNAEISARCQHIADRLAALGATVSDRARPDFDTSRATTVYRKLLGAATNVDTVMTHAQWRAYDNERAGLRLRWREFFKSWDVVLCPISATTAFPHDHSPLRGRKLRVNNKEVSYFQQLFWAGLPTLCYLPSTAFPTGPGTDGLPIGLQAFGDAYDDLITIDFVRQLSEHIGGFVPPPGYLEA